MARESSLMSSPVSMSSIIGAESLGSDVQSVPGLVADNAPELHFIPENAEGEKVFEYGDGDFELCVNGMLFQTHKYLLKRFSGLKRMIELKAADYLDLERAHGVEDFRNTLKVLYASPIEGPLEFDTVTLVSALRIATAYDYPALQKFAVNNLEKAHLSAIDRIRIAREFGLTSWETPAYVELCEREESITEEEANVLGISAFVRVARIREKEQRKKGEKSGAQYREETGGAGGEHEVAGEHGSGLDISTAPVVRAMASGKARLKKKKIASKAAATGEAKLEVTFGDTPQVDGVKMLDDAVKKSSQDPDPCFVDFSPMGTTHYRTASSGTLQSMIPGCQCQSPVGTWMDDCHGNTLGENVACQCTIAPCAAKELESAVEEIKSDWEPPQPIADEGKSNSNGLTELTSVPATVQATVQAMVQAAVHERLSRGVCNGQGN
ncbi:hypothetical protein FS749_001164 [Ceratobasidium sp. UAMH 11750]|nr:hypothetical protein FS749_001164 [Ceratobasidium sp. UAMH 11750]